MVWTALSTDSMIYNLYKKKLIEPITDGYIWLGKYRVAFGYRIRGGFNNDHLTSEIDYCCGASHNHYNDLFKKVKTIVENNPQTNPFFNLPGQSYIKPYYEDIEFCNIIDDLYISCIQK